MNPDRNYRGRFAPSPTGPLHVGSLVAALGSYLDAKAHGGQWLVRIEDLDIPRNVPGAAEDILRTLECFGMQWDGAVLYQSTRLEAYRSALDRLQQLGALYPCACSRKEIADSALSGIEGPVYPGTCRNGLTPGRSVRAMRVRTSPAQIAFHDRAQGLIHQQVEQAVGDFVVMRADGFFAYQLAVVVDDGFQDITHVVRGADLLLSTPRQIVLQRLLALPTPAYWHVPVVVNERGEKLSKQTGAQAVDVTNPARELRNALAFLGLRPPVELAGCATDLLAWGVANWPAIPSSGEDQVDPRVTNLTVSQSDQRRIVTQ